MKKFLFYAMIMSLISLSSCVDEPLDTPSVVKALDCCTEQASFVENGISVFQGTMYEFMTTYDWIETAEYIATYDVLCNGEYGGKFIFKMTK